MEVCRLLKFYTGKIRQSQFARKVKYIRVFYVDWIDDSSRLATYGFNFNQLVESKYYQKNVSLEFYLFLIRSKIVDNLKQFLEVLRHLQKPLAIIGKFAVLFRVWHFQKSNRGIRQFKTILRIFKTLTILKTSSTF